MNACEGGTKSENMILGPVPYVDEFRTSTAMEEMVVNFLIRMAFMSGDSKEKDMVDLYPPVRGLIVDAICTWPLVNIRFSWFEKLLDQAIKTKEEKGSDSDPSALVTGLDILDRAEHEARHDVAQEAR